MRNLFDPDVLGWPRLRDSLHIYVLPDADFTSSMRPAFDAIERFEGCAVVEPRWLHATITRIPWWRNEIDRTLLDLFAVELGDIAAGTAKFAIPQSGPLVRQNSVGMVGPNDYRWQSLLDRTRAAAAHIFGAERPLPAAPTIPHVSLGYGITNCDSAPLELALSGIDTAATLEVTALHFVAVHQNPVEGTFTWDAISTHALAGHDV